MDLQLKRLRKKAGYRTQADLARTLDVPERRYASWERGEVMISLDVACQIADVLNCTLDELAGRTVPTCEKQSDPRQRIINKAFESCNEAGRYRLADEADTILNSEKYSPKKNTAYSDNRRQA